MFAKKTWGGGGFSPPSPPPYLYPCIVSNAYYYYYFLLDSFFSYHIHTYSTSPFAANVICRAETTGLLSWPDTEAGTNHNLQCPNTTTMISRTCSLSGVWESVDLSLCTPFDSINTVSISVGFSVNL